MPQIIHINLDGGELPLNLLKPGETGQDIVACCADELELILLERGMVSGKHSTAFFARLPDGRLAMLEMSAVQLLRAAAAIRGRLALRGVIPTTLNPGIAFMADPVKRVVHFATEVPLERWDYTIEHAKKFWRELRQITEEASHFGV